MTNNKLYLFKFILNEDSSKQFAIKGTLIQGLERLIDLLKMEDIMPPEGPGTSIKITEIEGGLVNEN